MYPCLIGIDTTKRFHDRLHDILIVYENNFYFHFFTFTCSYDKTSLSCSIKKRTGLGSVETGLDGGEVDVCEVHLGGDQPASGQLVSKCISGDTLANCIIIHRACCHGISRHIPYSE
jgi:hypothetical protein